MPKPSFQDQIATLRNELELSTFLNKGVLQSNSEYKLRIAELESENAVLRKAESRLADTEDELESAQKRIRQLESTLRAAEERRAAAIAREQDARVAAECERDRFRAKHDTLRAALAELLGAASEESPVCCLSLSCTDSSRGILPLQSRARATEVGCAVLAPNEVWAQYPLLQQTSMPIH